MFEVGKKQLFKAITKVYECLYVDKQGGLLKEPKGFPFTEYANSNYYKEYEEPPPKFVIGRNYRYKSNYGDYKTHHCVWTNEHLAMFITDKGRYGCSLLHDHRKNYEEV